MKKSIINNSQAIVFNVFLLCSLIPIFNLLYLNCSQIFPAQLTAIVLSIVFFALISTSIVGSGLISSDVKFITFSNSFSNQKNKSFLASMYAILSMFPWLLLYYIFSSRFYIELGAFNIFSFSYFGLSFLIGYRSLGKAHYYPYNTNNSLLGKLTNLMNSIKRMIQLVYSFLHLIIFIILLFGIIEAIKIPDKPFNYFDPSLHLKIITFFFFIFCTWLYFYLCGIITAKIRVAKK